MTQAPWSGDWWRPRARRTVWYVVRDMRFSSWAVGTLRSLFPVPRSVEHLSELPGAHHLGAELPDPTGEVRVRGHHGELGRVGICRHHADDVVVGCVRTAPAGKGHVHAGRLQIE